MNLSVDQWPEIDALIKKIFDAMNGRINKFNSKACLYVNWARQMDNDVAGSHLPPNNVIINPLLTARYSPDIFSYKYNLAGVIIHELHHVDQITNFNRLQNDPVYEQCIVEAPVERMTLEFMTNHMYQLSDIIDPTVMFDFNDTVHDLNSIPYYPYHRRDHFTHMMTCLSNIIDPTCVDYVADYITTFRDNPYIVLTINGLDIIIVKDGIWYNIFQFNDLLNSILSGSRNAHIEYDSSVFFDKNSCRIRVQITPTADLVLINP